MILPTKEKLLQEIILNNVSNARNINILDATCGNGYDTFFLAQNFKLANIFALDIQEEALKRTKEKCNEFNNINYILSSHDEFLKKTDIDFNFIIFNTGYLPQSNSNVSTKASSTISALDFALKKLKHNSFLAITLYLGHDDKKEFNEVYNFLISLDKYSYIVFSYKTENTINSPILFLIEKKGKKNEKL